MALKHEMMALNPSVLRLTWMVVQETQSKNLLDLTDTALIRLILQQVARRILLNGDEVNALYAYVSSKTSLIRDMAESHPTWGSKNY